MICQEMSSRSGPAVLFLLMARIIAGRRAGGGRIPASGDATGRSGTDQEKAGGAMRGARSSERVAQVGARHGVQGQPRVGDGAGHRTLRGPRLDGEGRLGVPCLLLGLLGASRGPERTGDGEERT
jgi:hypothetical protein